MEAIVGRTDRSGNRSAQRTRVASTPRVPKATFFGSLGCAGEASGTKLTSCALSGRSWALFGSSWVLVGVILESFWSHLGIILISFAYQKRDLSRARFQERVCTAPGSILVTKWGRFGVVLGSESAPGEQVRVFKNH